MSEQPQNETPLKPKVWLGICVGSLTQLGLKTFLPILVLVAIRMWSLETNDKSLWLENPTDASHQVWFALQASVFLGSAIAGFLAGILSPRSSRIVPAALVTFSLLTTAFEQFPQPSTPSVFLVWALGSCIGLLVGFFLVGLFRSRNA